ncbi:MAG: aminotransferase class V-fold PLP-dependent enzyme [bacterium]|nr:aminotransferase class V-fold PLP-dependent enzyme [bacterium]
MRPCYFDNNATAPLDKRVLQAMLPFLKEDFFNPSGICRPAQNVRGALRKAREEVAGLLNAEPEKDIRKIIKVLPGIITRIKKNVSR